MAIADGEYWRLLSGHFAHLGYPHLALNLAGLILVWLLVGRLYSTWRWLLVAAFSIVVMDAGFWFVDSDMRWYVGLSGLLHGLLLAGARCCQKTARLQPTVLRQHRPMETASPKRPPRLRTPASQFPLVPTKISLFRDRFYEGLLIPRCTATGPSR